MHEEQKHIHKQELSVSGTHAVADYELRPEYRHEAICQQAEGKDIATMLKRKAKRTRQDAAADASVVEPTAEEPAAKQQKLHHQQSQATEAAGPAGDVTAVQVCLNKQAHQQKEICLNFEWEGAHVQAHCCNIPCCLVKPAV